MGFPVVGNSIVAISRRTLDLNAKRSTTLTARRFPLLGVRVDVMQIPDVVARMEEWIALRGKCRFIAVTGMHGVTEAQHDRSFKEILNAADLVVPDGFPLIWLGRRKGFAELRRRVYGPELMAAFCQETAAKGYRHFFYGGAPGVAEELAKCFAEKCPGLQIAGTYCPPFRALTRDEYEDVKRTIDNSQTDIVWVGLSTPKQERWMFEYRDKLKVPVLIGVGAAFDIHTERTSQAPRWMQEHGLEWFFRLTHEPKRLWRRYLLYGSEFVFLVLLESLGLKRFSG
jgi:N-acetylglucosaminyldiphosphoundecaprenol N-acetyl-beta-D-mannosaminyltransferase